MPNVLDILSQHVPFLSDDNESELWAVMNDILSLDRNVDVADLAQRTCMCGKHIDGFEDYNAHLRTMIEVTIS